MPGHQRFIVIAAKVMPVFHYKARFAGLGNMRNRRYATVRENVFIDPRIDAHPLFVAANGMQQEQPVRF